MTARCDLNLNLVDSIAGCRDAPVFGERRGEREWEKREWREGIY
jgi:hypothetical protein